MVMRRLQLATLICVVAGMCAGCGASRPVKYYVLDVAPAPASSASAQFPVTILVSRIAASHLYRDDRLVYGRGPVQLGTYEYERWSETPADMVQDLLVSALRASGQYLSVSPISSNMRGDYIIRGHLYALDEVDDKPSMAARFSIQIDLFDPKSGRPVWTDSYSQDEPVSGKTVEDVVTTLDHNVRAGMQQLTTNLGQYFASHPPQRSGGQ